MGRLDVAAGFGKKNIALLKDSEAPIIFLEPSCYSMFSQDCRELGLEGAEKVARRAVLFESFMAQLLAAHPDAIRFSGAGGKTAIHGHCHAKALTGTNDMAALARAIPDNDVALLDTGCCGMAGAFGSMDAKYELSLAVAKPLIDQIDRLEEGTRLVASGTSCRHQIEHLADRTPLHMAELLAAFLP